MDDELLQSLELKRASFRPPLPPPRPSAAPPKRMLRVAVEGCCHGELDLIYNSIKHSSVDLLLICGDFQCIRQPSDLKSMAVPEKYRTMNTFHKYFTGKAVAPVMTVIIGGNHEASNVLQSLYYGGFLAPNIFFLGFAGCVRYRGLRIAGLSGIFNQKNYQRGHFERPPYSDDTIRSVYHMRELEVYRIMHLHKLANEDNGHKAKVDVFLSHDWPSQIWTYGNSAMLLKKKPYFRDDMKSGRLGNPPLMDVLQRLRPSYWFAAHLHVKFDAFVPFAEACEEVSMPRSGTMFLALDKAIKGRSFIEIIEMDVSGEADTDASLSFDAEWLSILTATHSQLSVSRGRVSVPNELSPIAEEDVRRVRQLMAEEYGDALTIPDLTPAEYAQSLESSGSLQTDRLLRTLGLPHIWTQSFADSAPQSSKSSAYEGADSSLPMKRKVGAHADFSAISIVDVEKDLLSKSMDLPPAADSNEVDIDDI